MPICAAIGCKVETAYFMCGSHWHMVPARLRRALAQDFNDENRLEAIRIVAIKEHKTRLYETWRETVDTDDVTPEERTMKAPRRSRNAA